MRPIIIDMRDMSDSAEVYDSKPNRFLVYTIYLILLILLSAILWMSISKMDIVVKSNGVFKGSNAQYDISSGVTGCVQESCVESGAKVQEGDILFVLTVEELSDTIQRYQEELESAKNRVDILQAYDKSLNGDTAELKAYEENPYYQEIINKRKLLYANVNLGESNVEKQAELYQGNVDSLSASISKYRDKINLLNEAKQCILSRNNTMDASVGACYSMVSNYLSNYDYTALQYDNKIRDYQGQIDAIDEKIREANNQPVEEVLSAPEIVTVSNVDSKELKEESLEENAQQDVLTVEAAKTYTVKSAAVNKDELVAQKETLITARDSLQAEKEKALMSLELQQVTSIEQQISGYEDTILSLDNNLNTARLQLNTVCDNNNNAKETVAVLTEKGVIASEILTYEEKIEECENYLKGFDIQNENCYVKAGMSGYFYPTGDLNEGSYVSEGMSIGTIYPEAQTKYYAELYVENADIGKIKEGQEVKFEIAAYPSNEYGYFKGCVDNIAKDISVDQNAGYAYYVVRVNCENVNLKGKDGKEANLMNGMACQSKIVVDEKTIMSYFLEKIDLLD